MKSNRINKEILMSILLVVASSTTLNIANSYFSNLEEDISNHYTDKIDKEEKEKEKRRTESFVKDIENKMFENMEEAEKYLHSKSVKIKNVASANNIDLFSTKDGLYHKVDSFESDKESSQYLYDDDIDNSDDLFISMEWVGKVDGYSKNIIPDELDYIDTASDNRYGCIEELMALEIEFNSKVLKSNKYPKELIFLTQCMNIDGVKISEDELIKRVENYIYNDKPINDLNLSVETENDYVSVKYSNKNTEYIKKSYGRKGFELVFDSEIKAEEFQDSLYSKFNLWKSERTDLEKLYTTNLDGVSHEGYFNITINIDEFMTGEGYSEYYNKSYDLYKEETYKVYDFINKLYGGKYPISKDVFVERIIDVGIRNYYNEDLGEFAYPGVIPYLELHQGVLNKIGKLELYIKIPYIIKNS